jgi:hypothetical protein
VDILIRLDVTEHDDITVVDTLTLIAVLITGLHNEANRLRPLRIQTDQVTAFVELSAVFGSLKE